MAVLVGVLALEAGLRLIDRPRWDRDVVAGWRCLYDNNETNQLGFRGPPIAYGDSNIVVLLVGDSFVEAIDLEFHDTPARVLQKHLQAEDLRFKVFNIGAGGFGTDQQLLALREYYQHYRADHVILWQVLANDVWNNIFPTHWPRDGFLKPTYRLESGRLTGPNYEFSEVALSRARTKLGIFLNRLRNPRRGLDASWEQFLPPPYQPFTGHDGEYRLDWDPAGPNAGVNLALPEENLATEKSHMAIYLTPASDRMRYGLELTRALLHSMQSLCREKGSQFSIFYPVVPSPFTNTLPTDVMVQKVGRFFYRASHAQSEANRSLVNYGFDTIPARMTVPNWRISPSKGHFKPEANNQVMQILAENILRRTPRHHTSHR
jgi:hypothetical protein